MLLIGDAHGRINEYKEIVEYLEGDGIHSILLGELGFQGQHDWFMKSGLDKHNKILFGNHDFFPYLNLSYSLGRFNFIPKYKMFSIAGAFSIDRQYRLAGRDWFKEEEMTFAEEILCGKAYLETKPEIVISHDAPESVVDALFNYSYKFPNGNTTNRFLDTLLKYHKPKTWVFAHHHETKDKIIDGTRFICLDELETLSTDHL